MERLAVTRLTDAALASHLLEYYRSLGLLPPGPRLPPWPHLRPDTAHSRSELQNRHFSGAS